MNIILARMKKVIADALNGGEKTMTEKEADDYLFQHWDEIIKEASDTGESLNIILSRHTGIDSKTSAKLIDSAWLTYQVCKRGQ